MKKVINISIIVLLVIALLCGGGLGYYYISSALQKKNFDRIRQAFLQEDKPTEQSQGNSFDSSLDERNDAMMGLKQQNSDLFGWLEILGTSISYPVMYTPQDPEYYLRRGFEKENSTAGTPFVDARYTLEPQSDNCIIYGHNMKDGTMFSDLFKYQSEDFYNENSKINFYKENKTEVYSVIAVVEADIYSHDTYDFYAFVNSDDESAWQDYIANAYSSALHKTIKEVPENTKLLTLSTCLPNEKDGRLIVVAALDSEKD